MAKEDITVKSIRADEETYNKFKEIASSNFNNQGQALSALVNLYEMEQSKSNIGERKTEIEGFQACINKLNKMYIDSLELNKDAEMRIRDEFNVQLKSKDAIIIGLQSEVDKFKQSNLKIMTNLNDLKNENEVFIDRCDEYESLLKKQQDDVNILKNSILSKDKIIENLENSHKELENKLADSKNLEITINNLKEQENIYINNLKNKDNELEKLTKQLEYQEREHEAALNVVKNEYDAKYNKDINEYYTKIHQLNEEILKFKEEIFKLNQKNIQLSYPTPQSTNPITEVKAEELEFEFDDKEIEFTEEEERLANVYIPPEQ